MLREETDTDAFLSAKPHQIRAETDIAEADDSSDGMNRDTEADFPVHLDDNSFSLFGEVSTLSRHKKSVEMFFHRLLSILDK
jgi:hypothetical protein